MATQPELSQPGPELVPDECQPGGSGLQQQELHFTQMPVQTSIDGGVVTRTGTVISNHLYNADDEFDDIIVELPPPWYSWLDIVVTGYPDGRDPESLPRVP